MPIIYHEGYSLGDGAGNNQLLKDTVGWTGKNRAYSQTNNAVIAHIENGITYDVSWTGSATVTLKKNSASGATITSGSTSPLSFTADADYELYFGSSATVTNIMVKDSRITDPTYEPYHESVEVMYEEEIHGVNLFNPNFTKKTEYGVTFTVNTDKTISTNGTTTADARTVFGKVFLKEGTYTLSGNPYNVATNTIRLRLYNSSETKIFWDDGNGVTFTVNSSEEYTLAVRYGSGAVFGSTFKPMLRKADIDDPTYRPYNPQAIQNQLNAQGVLGAKNLLLNTSSSGTYNGITFTKNSDGSVTVNGTATAHTTVTLFNVTSDNLPSGNYIISTQNVAGANSTRIDVNAHNGSTYVKTIISVGAIEAEKEITIDYNGYTNVLFNVFVYNGNTVNNITFYPMLRLASDPDDTYQPYAMTNRELTEEKINIADLKTVVSASSDFADFKTRIASL